MALLQAIIILCITSVLLGETVDGYKIDFPQFNLNTEGIDNLYINNNNSGMSMNALQVTPDTNNKSPQFSLTNRSGRVLLKKKFRVYNVKGTVSFNTWFTFNIQNVSGNGGEGLAFIVTSANYDYIPANSYGEWLGLFNASTNGHSSAQVLAVEFDTIKSPGTNDPDANHVGINVNDINSINFTSLHDQIYLNGGYDIQAWIEYDGSTKILSVFVAKYPAAKPPQPLVYSITDLSNNTLGSEVYFGFSASTGNGTELHCVKAWNFTINTIESKRPLVIALSVCLPFALIVAFIVVVFLKRRKSKADSAINIGDALENIPGRPREFRYRDLKKATDNFSPEVLLGRGGFGSVYKGTLPKEKTVVAVKRMTNGIRNGKDVFISEISVINRLRHKNLVPLLGWCHEKGELMMVYEWMPNGSLDKHIFNRDAPGRFLDLKQRYKIVSDVASALLYLHEGCEQKVIHRDVKPGNIMLDTKYNAHLGDFGLARLIEHDLRSFHATKEAAGTPGYMAPEYIFNKRATAKSDVFSFGAVILAVTCGKLLGNSEVVDLIDWVRKLYDENRLLEAADSRLATLGSVNGNEEDSRLATLGSVNCNEEDNVNGNEEDSRLATLGSVNGNEEDNVNGNEEDSRQATLGSVNGNEEDSVNGNEEDSRLATPGSVNGNEEDSVNGNEEDIRRLLMLGLACSSQNPEERPTMKEVTQILARTMPPPSLPMPPPSVHRSRPDVGSSQLARDISSTATLPTSTGSEVWYSMDE